MAWVLWFAPGLVGAGLVLARWQTDFGYTLKGFLVAAIYVVLGSVGLMAGVLLYRIHPTARWG